MKRINRDNLDQIFGGLPASSKLPKLPKLPKSAPIDKTKLSESAQI
ncbi:hypothetical protein [Pseudoalteromonas viridis]|uniref:Uncharacterized protein n=1 Tax=Pseudoalteromonas viridis TaxID=339617 RepID=A0ABX7V9E3_9GAMM|nr:hypothetical protein [Pseudoalteromonas viridis]QTL36391.1 hypothetical protein J5X90_04920 [Pseudoalteromonas viridis]